MDKAMIRKAICCGALLVCAGCMGTIRVSDSRVAQQFQANHPYEHTTAAWFWGLSSPDSVTVAGDCGSNGMATVEIERTVGDWISMICTLGIRSPVTVRVVCK
jgi:hypothetical protein